MRFGRRRRKKKKIRKKRKKGRRREQGVSVRGKERCNDLYVYIDGAFVDLITVNIS